MNTSLSTVIIVCSLICPPVAIADYARSAPCEAYNAAAVIFIGEVIPPKGGTGIRFTVDSVYKGSVAHEIKVLDPMSHGYPEVGRKYLVYAAAFEESLMIGWGGLRQLDLATADLAFLKLVQDHAIGQKIFGEVNRSYLHPGRLIGVRVLARHIASGLTFSAVSDTSGTFEIPNVPVGIYRLRTNLPHYHFLESSEIRITEHGCVHITIQDESDAQDSKSNF